MATPTPTYKKTKSVAVVLNKIAGNLVTIDVTSTDGKTTWKDAQFFVATSATESNVLSIAAWAFEDSLVPIPDGTITSPTTIASLAKNLLT